MVDNEMAGILGCKGRFFGYVLFESFVNLGYKTFLD